MASKKKVRNSFYFFMVDYREREEARGSTFPNGMRDVAIAADSEWQNFTPEQKKPYEAMAKKWKSDQRQTADKFTTLGTRFKTVDEKLRREEEENSIMDQTIEAVFQSLQNKADLMDEKFFLMHVNFYCQLENHNSSTDVFIPAEIAIVEFNLQYGVLREYHTFVRANIPSGYAFSAKTHSEETHEIPPNFELGEKIFIKILHDIKSFLIQGQTSRILPPVYTMPNNRNLNNSLDAVKSTLKCLCESSVSVTDDSIFRVFNLGKLLFQLKNACQKYHSEEIKNTEHLAETDLEADYFSSRRIGCEFHTKIDRTLCCSLSVVKRWAYIICDHCCQYLGIPLILGKHCPIDADVSKEEPTHAPETTDRKYSQNIRCDESDNEVTASVASARPQKAIDKPQKSPNQPCWSAVTKGAMASNQQLLPTRTFADNDFPAIGQLSLAEARNRSHVVSDQNFPPLGRGRSQLRPLGRGRGNNN